MEDNSTLLDYIHNILMSGHLDPESINIDELIHGINYSGIDIDNLSSIDSEAFKQAVIDFASHHQHGHEISFGGSTDNYDYYMKQAKDDMSNAEYYEQQAKKALENASSYEHDASNASSTAESYAKEGNTDKASSYLESARNYHGKAESYRSSAEEYHSKAESYKQSAESHRRQAESYK